MEGRSRTWEGQAGQMSVGVTGTSGSPSGLVWCREQRRALSGLLPAHKGLELQTPQLDVGAGVVWAREPPRCPRWACSAHGLAYASNLILVPVLNTP